MKCVRPDRADLCDLFSESLRWLVVDTSIATKTTTTMVKKMIAPFVLVLGLVASFGESFAPLPTTTPFTRTLLASAHNTDTNSADAPLDDRRSLFQKAAAAVATASILTINSPAPALAVDAKKVVVAGATGQTGRRVLERLAAQPGLSVVAGVRNVDKAEKSLSESSTVVRGAMVQKVGSVDTSSVELKHLDVVKDSVDDIAKTLEGADALVICTGFIPGNPLKMNEEAHKVDNVGTCHLVDAAKQAGVKKVVMVSRYASGKCVFLLWNADVC